MFPPPIFSCPYLRYPQLFLSTASGEARVPAPSRLERECENITKVMEGVRVHEVAQYAFVAAAVAALADWRVIV